MIMADMQKVYTQKLEALDKAEKELVANLNAIAGAKQMLQELQREAIASTSDDEDTVCPAS